MSDKIRILYIDDYELDRELVKDALEKEHGGFEVMEASDKQEFETLLKNRKFDVVLSDFNIAGFEGFQVLDMVRSHDPRIPVIIVTGTGSEEIAVKALNQGASDYVIKQPKHIRRLPQTILVAIEKMGLRNQREKAETSLKESEKRYRSLFESMMNGYAYCRMLFDGNKPQDFIFIDVNKAFETLTGTKSVVGKKVSEVIPGIQATDPELFEIYGRVVRTGTPETFEMYVKALSMWFSVSVYSHEKEHFVIVFDNIQKRKQAAEELVEREEKYRSLVESTEDSIYLVDRNSTYLFMNEKHLSRLGLQKDKLLGRTYSEFHSEEDTQEFAAIVEKVFETGRPFQQEHRSLKDNRHFLRTLSPVKESDERTRAITVVSKDITARVNSEAALRQAHNIINRSPAVIFLWKNAEGWPVEFVSDNVVELFGHTAEEFISGKVSFSTTVHPDDLERVAQEVTTYSEEEDRKEFSHEPYRIITKNGEVKWLDDMSFIKRDKKGDITHYEGIVLDISDKKQAEIEKGRLQSQLQQSQKMEAIGTLAGGIAHDFNNILAIILGNAELAADHVLDSNPASDSLKEIHRASIRAKDMVHQLLAFSRKTDEETKPLNLAPIIKESMKMLRSAIPTSVEFKEHISDDPCNVMGDAAQINQIVMNLVTNAADAMSEEGGVLEVALEKILLQEEKPCFDWVLSPGTYVRLIMRDTGEGIAPKIMDRIFEPYYTSKEAGKGTGMGLSVVHGIVKRHGGGVRVESEPGKGTLFEIYFPVSEKTAEEEKESGGEMKGGTERILFVDDEESLVNLNRQFLERLGYDVKSTTKPVEALEWFRADPDQFDVIITDMTMPRMTGDRLAAEVLKIRPHMPVIICTGYSERMSPNKAEALGVRKYIDKPIDLRNLASALRKVLEEK